MADSERGDLGRAQGVEDLLLPPSEQLGQHLVHDHRGEQHVGLGAQPRGQLERLAHRHLLGRRDDHRGGDGRIAEDVDHPRGLVADPADLHQLVDRLGRRQLTDHVAGGRGVDHDEVVGALTDLVAELADGEDLLDPRGGVGHEVEGAGDRTHPPEQRHLQLELQVLLERLLGVHGHAEQVRPELTGVEGQRPGLERAGQVALGVDLARQRALALLGREQGQRGGDAGLADPALAGHEQQPPVEQLDVRAWSPGPSHAVVWGDQPAPKPTRRAASPPPSSM